MTAALAWAGVATMLVAILGAVVFSQRADLRRAREDTRTAELKLIELAMSSAEETAKLYERVLDRERIDTSKIVESAVRMATTGTTAEPKAEVQAPEATGEQMLVDRIRQETIATGMIRLREEYTRAGMAVPEEEILREEAELMLYGILPESATAGGVRS